MDNEINNSLEEIDYLSLSKDEVRKLFDKSLKNHNTVMARTLWGLFEKDKEDIRINYLKILFEEEKYSEMWSYSAKHGIMLPERNMLLSYAFAGEEELFIHYYRKTHTDFWYLSYLTTVLYYNSKSMTRDLLTIIAKDINSGIYTIANPMDSQDGRKYANTGLQVIAWLWDKICEEAAYQDVLSAEDKDQFTLVKDDHFYVISLLFAKPFHLNDSNDFYLCYDALERIVNYLEPLFLKNKKDIDSFIDFIGRVFLCHLDEKAIGYTIKYIEYMKSQYIKHTDKHNYAIVDKIRSLYIRSYSTFISLYTSPNEQLDDFLHFIGVSDISHDNQVEIRRITNRLTLSAQIAYDSAYRLYSFAVSDNYGFSDAGPISLAFYRIIESESSERIWKPLLQKCGIESLTIAVNEQINCIQDKKLANHYKMTWIGTAKNPGNIRLFQEIIDDKRGLMLGELYYYTEFTRKNHNKDKVAALLFNGIKDTLTEDGLEAFMNGTISELYGKDNREKYRNPPAHNKYLSLKLLTECKDYVDAQLINISNWCIK